MSYNGVFFSGLCGAGKSTAAKYLVNKHAFTLGSEGTKVRMFTQLLGYNPKERGDLQHVGQNARKAFGATFWLDELLKDLRGPRLTIDDVRCPEDANLLLTLGWVGIRIECPTETRYERLEKRDGKPVDVATVEAESEHLLDNYEGFKWRIDNSGGLCGIHRKLDSIVDQITGRPYVAWPECWEKIVRSEVTD